MWKTRCLFSTAKRIVIDQKTLNHQRLEANTDMLIIDKMKENGFDLYDKFWVDFNTVGDCVILAWHATTWERLITRFKYWWKDVHITKGSK